MSEQLGYEELLARLRQMVATGTDASLHMVTDDHHFVGIDLRGGKIVALHHGPHKGQRALADIRRLRSASLSVAPADQHAAQADLPSTDEILHTLTQRETPAAPTPAPAASRRRINPEIQALVLDAMLHCIGPIAHMLVRDAIEQVGEIRDDADLTRLIDLLAEDIDDPALANRFRAQVLGR